MKFLCSKAAMIFIAVILLLCIVAAGIAVDISIVMIKKKNQAIKPVPLEQVENIQASAKPVKVNKLEKHDLYFNGQIIDDVPAFLEEESCFIPIDTLLKELGVKFKYFTSDDILEFVFDGKKVLIEINQTEITIGGEKIKLKFAAQAAKNHILVPIELLDYLDSFTVTKFLDKKSIFINYFPQIKKYTDGFRVLKTSNGVANISDIVGNSAYWKSRNETMGDDKIQACDDKSRFIIKALNKVYYIKDRQARKPRLINVNSSASWSVDGRYLYWVDKTKRSSYSYNIETGTKKNLGDYFVRAGKHLKDMNGNSAYDNGGILYDYKQGSTYKRVALTNAEYSSNYTFIERRGKTFIEGPVSFSPDHKKILFYEKGKGYYSAGVDGSNKKFVGIGKDAVWINNNKVMLSTSKGMYVVSKDGTDITDIMMPWRKLGQTSKGDVFYTDGNMLYCETNGKEVQLLRLVVPCDYIFSSDIGGPYIAVSSEQNKVYLINKGTVDTIGDYSQLLKGSDLKSPRPLNNSILTSPDGILTSIARSVNGFINIDILDNKSGSLKGLTLNHVIGDTADSNKFNMKWINGTSLIIYTSDKGWLVKLEGKFEIYNWVENKNESIEGILLK